MKTSRPILVIYMDAKDVKEKDYIIRRFEEIRKDLEEEYIVFIIQDKSLRNENKKMKLEVLSIENIHSHRLSEELERKLEEYLLIKEKNKDEKH